VLMKKDVKSAAPGISVAIAVVLIGVPSVKFLLSNEVADRYNAVASITNYDAVRMGDQENCMIVQSGAGGRRSLAARYSVHPKAKRVGHERSLRTILNTLPNIRFMRRRSRGRGRSALAR